MSTLFGRSCGLTLAGIPSPAFLQHLSLWILPASSPPATGLKASGTMRMRGIDRARLHKKIRTLSTGHGAHCRRFRRYPAARDAGMARMHPHSDEEGRFHEKSTSIVPEAQQFLGKCTAKNSRGDVFIKKSIYGDCLMMTFRELNLDLQSLHSSILQPISAADWDSNLAQNKLKLA